MKRDYTLNELSKMVKKNYLDSLPGNVVEMQRYINMLEIQIKELNVENKSLKKTIKNGKFNVENDPSYVLGKAVAKYVKDTIKTDVMKNLNVEVDSEWDPYSGQQEHYHKTEISWNEE